MMEVDTTTAGPTVEVAVPAPPPSRAALPGWVAQAARPGGLYLASRAVVLAAMWMASRLAPAQSLGKTVIFWDSGWYLMTARLGYPHALPMTDGRVAQSTLAFFPGYPLCIRAVHRLGFSYEISGLLIAAGAGLATAVLMWLLLQRMWGNDAADRGVALFCFFPASFVLSGTYAEPLVLALAAGSLLALLSRRWITSGVLAALASFTSPHALALAAACAWAAAVAIRQRREWRSLVAPVLAPLGFVAFQLFLWARTGVRDAYEQTHGAWDVHLAPGDTGHKFAEFFRHPLVDVNITVAVVGTLFLAVTLWLLVKSRPPGAVLIFTIGMMVPVMVSSTLGARPRFLMTAFPLVAVLGRWVRGNAFTAALAASATLLGCFTVLSVHSLLATP